MLPGSITAGGKARTTTQHLRNSARPEVTAPRIERVLDGWIMRGIQEIGGRESMNYMAFVPGIKDLFRVAVSMDDQRIITAFVDRTATRNWNKGNRDYFREKYRQWEEHHERTLR